MLSQQVYTLISLNIADIATTYLSHRNTLKTKEINSLKQKETFKVVQFLKDKARICVRGDLESIIAEEKRAVTLATRIARMLFVLVAVFNLDLRQRDTQQEATGVLAKLGLRQIPEDPYVFVADGIIMFFYIDDILIVSYRTAKEKAR
ncbi:hypothetical protein N7523_004042 [Penicillium sp. IBT 18751x]|nr:hypothetical protein N7523_004042 [Penicillium sp. IBT 18751x]